MQEHLNLKVSIAAILSQQVNSDQTFKIYRVLINTCCKVNQSFEQKNGREKNGFKCQNLPRKKVPAV